MRERSTGSTYVLHAARQGRPDGALSAEDEVALGAALAPGAGCADAAQSLLRRLRAQRQHVVCSCGAVYCVRRYRRDAFLDETPHRYGLALTPSSPRSLCAACTERRALTRSTSGALGRGGPASEPLARGSEATTGPPEQPRVHTGATHRKPQVATAIGIAPVSYALAAVLLERAGLLSVISQPPTPQEQRRDLYEAAMFAPVCWDGREGVLGRRLIIGGDDPTSSDEVLRLVTAREREGDRVVLKSGVRLPARWARPHVEEGPFLVLVREGRRPQAYALPIVAPDHLFPIDSHGERRVARHLIDLLPELEAGLQARGACRAEHGALVLTKRLHPIDVRRSLRLPRPEREPVPDFLLDWEVEGRVRARTVIEVMGRSDESYLQRKEAMEDALKGLGYLISVPSYKAQSENGWRAVLDRLTHDLYRVLLGTEAPP